MKIDIIFEAKKDFHHKENRMKNITILGVWTPALIFAVIHPAQA